MPFFPRVYVYLGFFIDRLWIRRIDSVGNTTPVLTHDQATEPENRMPGRICKSAKRLVSRWPKPYGACLVIVKISGDDKYVTTYCPYYYPMTSCQESDVDPWEEPGEAE